VPNLDFYATSDNQSSVLSAMFDLGVFRVFEAYSEPDNELREFGAPEEIPDAPFGPHLMLYAVGSGPEPTARCIDLNPGVLGDATFRYECQGWGLIQLHFGCFFREPELRWSHTNHNTEKRAANWAEVGPEMDDPAQWNWTAVTRSSGALNRAIRKMAVDKIGSHPVLPRAAQLIARAGLKYEYGTGIHGDACGGSGCAINALICRRSCALAAD